MVYRLRKVVYGLTQAHKAWNNRFGSFLTKLGFNKCISEHILYVKGSSDQDQFIICIYMDDLLVTSSNEDELAKFKENKDKEFEMSNLGNFAYFLGMEIVSMKHGVLFHHNTYAEDILKKFKMRNCNLANTPMETNIKLNKESDDDLVDNTLYKQIIGL